MRKLYVGFFEKNNFEICTFIYRKEGILLLVYNLDFKAGHVASSIGKSGMFCRESRDLNMAAIGDFIKQNLRQRG